MDQIATVTIVLIVVMLQTVLITWDPKMMINQRLHLLLVASYTWYSLYSGQLIIAFSTIWFKPFFLQIAECNHLSFHSWIESLGHHRLIKWKLNFRINLLQEDKERQVLQDVVKARTIEILSIMQSLTGMYTPVNLMMIAHWHLNRMLTMNSDFLKWNYNKSLEKTMKQMHI